MRVLLRRVVSGAMGLDKEIEMHYKGLRWKVVMHCKGLR